MKILLLSRYCYLGASSRYRFYQYLPYIRQQGLQVIVSPLFNDKYLKAYYAGQRMSFSNILNVLEAYGNRIIRMLLANDFDLIWIEKEVLPWLPVWVEHFFGLSKIPFVVDYDDAIFHRYDQYNSKVIKMLLGRKIDRVMRQAVMVVVGNDYLAERAKEAGAKRIEILPTVIDLEKYCNTSHPQNNVFTVGWIGSPGTSKYLIHIAPALEEICRQRDAQLVVVGAGKIELPGVPVQFIPWSETTEVEEIKRFDVGIMPLPDEPWERGKCGFKLIQYMACTRPVIGSPVGVNNKIIEHGVNGYQAKTKDEWVHALSMLKINKVQRQQMGECGRKLVEKEYCLQVTAPILVKILQSVKR